jgi:predicted enzyme related to lactoylglutathione lyase
MNGMQAGPGGTIVYFASNDCAVELSRVAGAGGQVLQEKMSIAEYGFVALCIDTEGNTIGLHSMK